MLEIKVVQARDFLNVAAKGRYEFARAQALFKRLAELNKPPHEYAVLLDLRGAEGHATTADLYELAMLMNDYAASFRNKMAILVPANDSRRYANVEFFALCAANRGFRVSAFTSFEEAMTWVNEIVRISGEIPILPLDAGADDANDAAGTSDAEGAAD